MGWMHSFNLPVAGKGLSLNPVSIHSYH